MTPCTSAAPPSLYAPIVRYVRGWPVGYIATAPIASRHARLPDETAELRGVGYCSVWLAEGSLGDEGTRRGEYMDRERARARALLAAGETGP
jgi:hypothetical protein